MRSLAFVAVALVACGGDTKTKNDAPASGDAPHDSRPGDARPADAPLDGPPGTVLLTVKNVLNWCSVSVDGGSASTGPQQRVFVLPGQIPLTATKADARFEVGSNMWHHTDGDTAGSGEKGNWTTNDPTTATSSTTVTVASTGPKCVWVCCPFTSGAGCAVPDQCQ